MKVSGQRVSILPLLSTALVAAVAGALSVAWDRPDLAGKTPVVHDARDSGLRVTLQPDGSSRSVGAGLSLSARFSNEGDDALVVTGNGGVFDLSVERLTSAEPERGVGAAACGDTTFLAISGVAAGRPEWLQPGHVSEQELDLGSAPPFDRPGLYRISGAWRSVGIDAPIEAFAIWVGPPTTLDASTHRGVATPGA